METEYKLTVKIPSLDDFAQDYKNYANSARTNFNFLFEVIMTPENFINARAVTQALGLPAVAGVAKACESVLLQQTEVKLDGFTKQFIGAVVCSLMEANGFHKTGEKRYVQYPGFTRGEFYAPDSK